MKLKKKSETEKKSNHTTPETCIEMSLLSPGESSKMSPSRDSFHGSEIEDSAAETTIDKDIALLEKKQDGLISRGRPKINVARLAPIAVGSVAAFSFFACGVYYLSAPYSDTGSLGGDGIGSTTIFGNTTTLASGDDGIGYTTTLTSQGPTAVDAPTFFLAQLCTNITQCLNRVAMDPLDGRLSSNVCSLIRAWYQSPAADTCSATLKVGNELCGEPRPAPLILLPQNSQESCPEVDIGAEDFIISIR